MGRSKKKQHNLLYSFYQEKQDSQQPYQQSAQDLRNHFSKESNHEYSQDQFDKLVLNNQSSRFYSSQKASSMISQQIKNIQISPFEKQQRSNTSNKSKLLKKSFHSQNQDQYDEDLSVQIYKDQLFKDVTKKNAASSNTTGDIIDVDLDQPIISVKRRGSESNSVVSMESIRKEIKRQQKLDLQKIKKQKKELNPLLKLQPKSIQNLQRIKMQRRQKIITKRTLQLLSKKFDQYYAYQNNFEYKGPKISILEIGKMFDIGGNTIHKLYTEWMNDPTFYDRLIRYDLRKRTPQRRLTVERLQHIARLIKENPFMTQYQICVQLNKIEDLKCFKDGQRVQINKTTVSRLLRAGKFRKKRVRCIPKQKNTTKSLQKRYQFSAKYKQLVDKHAKIYFLDESGFNLYMTREKAWSRPNEEITVNCPISKGKRFSLIAIIGQDGLAHWRIIQGTYRKHQYLDFIKELFEKLLENKVEPDREKWLIMDNCAIHDKQQTMQLAQKWGVNVMYLPAYSPQLNPIQMWFHEIKTKIRKINYSGEKQLLEIMQRTLKQYQEWDFSNYYHGSLKFIQKGLRKQKF